MDTLSTVVDSNSPVLNELEKDTNQQSYYAANISLSKCPNL